MGCSACTPSYATAQDQRYGVNAAHTSSRGMLQMSAAGTLLGNTRNEKRTCDFYFVEHRRKRLDSHSQEFWAHQVGFWEKPWVLKTARQSQKELGLQAYDFFPICDKAYSTWEVSRGKDSKVLQDYLDDDICPISMMANNLIKLNWKPKHESRLFSAKEHALKATTASFFVVKHTMYNKSAEKLWSKHEFKRTEASAREKDIGLVNHQFRSVTQDLMFSTWELNEGIKVDALQEYLDEELGEGHMGSEVFQVYGTKNLHPFSTMAT